VRRKSYCARKPASDGEYESRGKLIRKIENLIKIKRERKEKALI